MRDETSRKADGDAPAFGGYARGTAAPTAGKPLDAPLPPWMKTEVRRPPIPPVNVGEDPVAAVVRDAGEHLVGRRETPPPDDHEATIASVVREAGERRARR